MGGFCFANPGSLSNSSRAQHVAHLAVLGLPASADREAVRQRYLQLVKIHHPDTSTDPDTVDKFRSGDVGIKGFWLKTAIILKGKKNEIVLYSVVDPDSLDPAFQVHFNTDPDLALQVHLDTDPDPDTDPIRIQGFGEQKVKEEIKLIIS